MGHRVPLHDSKCKNLHGHRYAAEVSCAAEQLTEEGFVIDFGEIKRILGAWIDEHWDHNVVYQASDGLLAPMAQAHRSHGLRQWYAIEAPPTAEHLARYLFDKAVELLADHRVRVTRVRIYETPNCWAEVP